MLEIRVSETTVNSSSLIETISEGKSAWSPRRRTRNEGVPSSTGVIQVEASTWRFMSSEK